MVYYSLTPRAFTNLLIGFRKKENREFKESWEQTRAIIVSALVPHLKKGASTKPTSLYPLPWDSEKGAGFDKIDIKEAYEKGEKRWEKIDKK